MGKGINIIHTNCDPSAAQDNSLPRDSYLVTYGDNTEERFDVVQGLQSDIFDHYWDKYRENFVNMKQSEGRINPKLWGNEPPKTKSRK